MHNAITKKTAEVAKTKVINKIATRRLANRVIIPSVHGGLGTSGDYTTIARGRRGDGWNLTRLER